jgi:AraC-like DNA-binding protein
MWAANRRVITSIDELVNPIGSANTAPKALRPGAIRADMVRVDVGPVRVELGDFSFPFVTRGETLAERIALMAPLSRSTSGHLNGEAFAPGVLNAYGPVAEVAGASTGPLQFGVVSFPPKVLDRTALALGVDLDLPNQGEFRAVHTADWPRLRQAFGRLHRMVCDGPEDTESGSEAATIADTLLELATRSLSGDANGEMPVRHAHRNSVCIARACEERAAAARYQGVTLADLCAASEVSERRVRQAFYESYGMSPTAYLRIAALYEVRKALLLGPPTRDAVSRAASDFGFRHLSRFAGQYRALFGESPSATLDQRSQAATG